MKNIKAVVLALFISVMFLACNDEVESNVPAKLVVSQSVEGLTLLDQHAKAHILAQSTQKLVFAFSKEVGHQCNDFLATQKEDYLSSHNTVFIADVSAAPSLIRSMFIMPGLKDFKHTVLILDDENIAQSYSAGMNKEKIIAVHLNNGVISAIDALDDVKALETTLAQQ